MYGISDHIVAEREAGSLATFRLELTGVSNGMIIGIHGVPGVTQGRSFVVQLAGSEPEDFEDVITAVRDAFTAHCSLREGQ
jgi:hypothetical protein